MLSGDNGILQKATDAKTNTDNAQIKEKIRLAYSSALTKDIADQKGEVQKSTFEDELEIEFPNKAISIEDSADKKEWIITIDGVTENVPIGKDTPTTLKVADKRTANGQVVTALSTTETTTLEDDLGNIVKVPKGFGIAEDSGTKVEDGIVIEDVSHTDTVGSQFVWVPVGEITKTGGTKVTITLGRYKFNNPSDGTESPVETASKTNYETEAIIDGNEYDNYYEYNDTDEIYGNTKAKALGLFISSAIDNGGYYIARYEAGIIEATDNWANAGGSVSYGMSGYSVSYSNQLALKSTNGSVKPLVIKGKGVWNGITQREAAIISRNMYDDINSDLMNSYSWDTAVSFVEKCGTNSNYANIGDESGNLKKTGEYNDEQCHINDMSGNLYEWTTETYAAEARPCVYRGGSYNTMFANSNARYPLEIFRVAGDIGFRPILYL